ncbi:MAG TPA: ABC transporter substrate-binding protein [Iamia sp.]|nr:ABC transporter substrate-binding protein [Iamia sp.]
MAVVAVLALVVAACGGDDAAGGGGSGGGGGDSSRLVVGTDAEPTTLDIQAIDDNGLALSTWSINEGLVDFDAEGNIEPILAAELPVIDEADPTVWHLKLREGIEFTDGTPFDAEAVKYNVERIIDPDYGSVLAEELGGLSGATVVDELNVDLTTENPDPLLINRLRRLRIVSPTAAETETYGENPVGTGPYVLGEWTRGQSLTLEANADYWGDPKPTIEEIEIRFIPDANTRISALQSGEINVAVNPPDSQIGELQEDSALKVLFVEGGESGTTRFNTELEPYDDVKFRQALNYAIDKDTMVEQLFNGLYPVQDCNVAPPGVQGHNDDLEAYPYDPDKAEELLSEVDIPDGFTIDFTGSSAVYGSDREIQETMASYWRAVGLEVETTFPEIDPYLDAVYNPELPIVYGESDQALNSLIRQIGTFLERDGPVTALGEEDQAELDPLIETVKGTLDDDERDATMQEIAQIACDEAYFVFTFFRQDIAVLDADIEYESDLGQFEKVDWHRMRING